MSEPAKRVFQQVINHGYDEFLEQVATGRSMSINAVHEIAQGRIWTGLDALNRGLVDELGDLDAAVAAAAAEAGLEEGEYGSFVVEEPLSSTEQMIVDLLATAKALGVDPAVFVDEPRSLERLARQFEAMIDPVLRFNDPNGVYADCFCRIE
jgi:protease-4